MVWSRSAVNDNHFIVNWSMTWIPTHHHKDKYKKILLHHLHAALPLTDDSHIWKVRKKSRGNPLNELNPSLLIVTAFSMVGRIPPTTHHPARLQTVYQLLVVGLGPGPVCGTSSLSQPTLPTGKYSRSSYENIYFEVELFFFVTQAKLCL